MKPSIVVVLMLVALGSFPANADESFFRDGDERTFCDTSGPCPDRDYLDFRRIIQEHGRRHRSIRHGFRTADRWRSRDLAGRTGVTFFFEFDTDRDRDADRQVRVRRKDGGLTATLFAGRYLDRRLPGRIHVWRPARRGLRIQFSADLLRDGIQTYRWSLRWSNRNVRCPGSCHTDWAPDRGWYTHRL